MDSKIVLVTGIGGNVGQGIVRNIRKSEMPISIIGTNIDQFSAGNHLCDKTYLTPFAYEERYIPKVAEIVSQENVDLIIPSTDFEVFYLSANRDKIPCEIAVSDVHTAKICLDKYLTYQHLERHRVPFSKSFLPSEYSGQFENIIVKPREGRGSRGIAINPSNWQDYSDDYLVQELHKGKEITTAFYIDKKNSLHGYITLERHLANGATNECRVVFDYDEKLKTILLALNDCTEIRGSANLQSIVDDNGNIHPFEINCRISGTNSIRSNFGFEDVKYTLQEYLYGVKPSTPKLINGVAVRILMDVIYPNAEHSEALNSKSQNHYIF